METFDHLPVEGYRTPAAVLGQRERGNDAAREFHFLVRGREDLVARRDLRRVYKRLSVEAEGASAQAFGLKALRIGNGVEHAIDRGKIVGPRRKHAERERRGQIFAA